ncbi:hypothetical protein TRAPUB_1835 [Trametes pubescens]|uniref:Fungal-type protein kinase domain-containing protein n=2 Tax=Trametes pubescens TaxID=154538 RepID=A0A1M2VI97_TRAPU|nr:hypothetical protein TRAPUB_1842 [Trametes pubescens]OJT07305.1 hypothetical protein TRAPUB_1835 [Trametes pubescens]
MPDVEKATDPVQRAPTKKIRIPRVSNYVLHVWWYDREGAIQTYGLDFLEDLPRFITLLFARQRFSFEDWGSIPDLGRTANLMNEQSMNPALISLTGGPHVQTISVDTADIVYEPLGLEGRAGHQVFVGGQHPLEGTIIACALDRGEGDERIENHIPKVLDEKEHNQYNTGTVHQKLGIPLRKRHLQVNSAEVDVYRVLRVLTMERLKPIQTLEGEAFVPHYLIWSKHKIHHKVPSLNNVMYRRDHNGTILGVLNDRDPAVDASEPQTHNGFEATGTMPFMAVDLLCEEACRGEVRHLYRHDLEAFLWIFVWVLCCYNNANEVSPLPDTYRLWNSGDTVACQSSKCDLLQRGFKPADGPTTS